MDTVRWTISIAPERFLLLAGAVGTILRQNQESRFRRRYRGPGCIQREVSS